jgi:hypothetical protein
MHDSLTDGDQTFLHSLRQTYDPQKRVFVLPDVFEICLGVVDPLPFAFAPPVAVHVDIFGIEREGGPGLVERSRDVHPVGVLVSKDRPLLVDVAIFN